MALLVRGCSVLKRLLRCEVLWWLLWGCFHTSSVPSAPPCPVLYEVRGWDSFPGGMSLHVDPQPVLGAASPKESSLHKEVCGGLACSEGMRSTIQPTLMPDHSHFPGLAAVPCAPCRKAILVRSCWHQQAWEVPGLTQELQ